MIATLIPAELRLPEGAPRSPGIHQSKVLRAIAAETGILDAQWVEDLSLIDTSSAGWWESLDEASKLRISIGLAWEQFYIPTLPNVVDHPGEMCVNGIYQTPDGESVDVIITSKGEGVEHAIHEVKATYKSINTVAPRLVPPKDAPVDWEPEAPHRWNGIPDLANEWLWESQTKGYCKGAGTTLCYLHVLFVCGDYRYPIRPRLLVWRIEYTQEEINQRWELIRDYVQYRMVNGL